MVRWFWELDFASAVGCIRWKIHGSITKAKWNWCSNSIILFQTIPKVVARKKRLCQSSKLPWDRGKEVIWYLAWLACFKSVDLLLRWLDWKNLPRIDWNYKIQLHLGERGFLEHLQPARTTDHVSCKIMPHRSLNWFPRHYSGPSKSFWAVSRLLSNCWLPC